MKRIKKLLALSKSPNENEATAALQKATALMEAYKISEDSVIEYEHDFVRTNKRTSSRSYVWRSVLMYTCSWLYCTETLHSSAGAFIIIGEKFDVFMTKEMYLYLQKTIERMARNNIPKQAKTKFRESYKTGIVYALDNRIRTLGQAVSWASERDKRLESVSKKIEIDFGLTGAGCSSVTKASAKNQCATLNKKALHRGIAAGGAISLNRQTTGSGGRYLEA